MKQNGHQENENTPLVTILMPVYQGEKYIRKSLESTLAQTYGHLQIIIMDDCSTDRTKEIIQSFHDQRIEYHRRNVNKGYPYIDDMLPFAKGEYITIHTHDDLFCPDRIEVLLNCLLAYPDTDVVYNHAELIDENDNSITDWASEFAVQNPATTQEEVLHFMFAGHALPVGMMMKTKFILNKLNGTFEQKGYEAAPDYALNFEILRSGQSRIISKRLTKFRIHQNNYSKTKAGIITHDAAKIISKNRRELSIEQIFPQILRADSEGEGRRLRALCHYQLAMYMNRYGAFRFVRELVERDLELSLDADPAFAPAWNALGVVRWQSAMDYAISSHETLRTACKLDGDNPEFLTNYQTIAGRIGKDTILDNSPLNLQESLDKHLRIRTLWDTEIKKTTEATQGDPNSTEEKDYKKDCLKILMISSFYPPHHQSYEDLLCQQLYQALNNNNSTVKVLTSDFVATSYQKFRLYPIPSPGICRDLASEFPDNTRHASSNNQAPSLQATKHNLSVIKTMLSDYSPDIIIAWNWESFSDSTLSMIKSCNIPLLEMKEIRDHCNPENENTEELSRFLGTVLRNARKDITLRPLNEVIKESQPSRNREGHREQIGILWNAPIYDPSGYADEGRNFVLSLDKEGASVRVNPIRWSNKEVKLTATAFNKINELACTPLSDNFINVVHIFPPYFQRNRTARLNIGRTMFETDRIPEEWVAKCNEMDEIWVPTDFNLQTFTASGVNPEKLFKIPGPHDFSGYSLDVHPLPIEGKKGFSFLSTFDWNLRKGWDILLRAYLEEFREEEDVTLILKVWSSYGKGVEQLQEEAGKYIREVFGRDPAHVPDILFLDLNIPVEEMPRLYRAVDAYVMPTRGEGWGRPYMEAMAMGLPAIGTRWSGNTEFMNDENSFLIDFDLVEVPEDGWREVPNYKGHRWAEPSVPHLKSLMRRVYECRGEAREKGMHAREEVLNKYNGHVISEKIIRHINERTENKPPFNPTQSPLLEKGGKVSVYWEGSQFVYHSLALINREVGIELLKKDQVDISIIPYESHQFDETADPRYPALARSFHKKLPSADIHIRHQWPPNFNPPPDGRWVLIQPWEFGSLPKAWIPPIQNLIDEVWIPSQYVRQVYIDSGVSADKVHVVPNGINPEIFNPDGTKMKIHSKKGFKFLFVGGTIYRKGIDILISTYLKAFTSEDDVVLVIKDIGSKSFYSGQNLGDEIKKIRKNPKAPSIYYIEKDLTESEMASLYRECDCLVHPYRGEGFGLPVLEAMACGLPVIVTAGGSTDDFVDEQTGYRVPSRRTIFGNREIGNLETVNDTWFLEIDRKALQEQMRYVMTHTGEARAVGRNASQKVLTEFTWQRVAEQYLERMKDLLKKPILRIKK